MFLLKSRIVIRKDNYNIIYGIYLLFQIELKWLVFFNYFRYTVKIFLKKILKTNVNVIDYDLVFWKGYLNYKRIKN